MLWNFTVLQVKLKHKFNQNINNSRTIVRAGVTGATASFNFGQQVHAPVNFQGCYFFHNFYEECAAVKHGSSAYKKQNSKQRTLREKEFAFCKQIYGKPLGLFISSMIPWTPHFLDTYKNDDLNLNWKVMMVKPDWNIQF